MPTGNINVDHIDINSLSDTPLDQIKPVEDLPTDGTVSSPTGEQDISNAPLQISSSKRISLKTLAQFFDHILSQNNNLKDLKLDGDANVDTSFNKLISEISNGEISNISQILGDPKMTNSIWLFLVKTLYDLSKAQLNSFKDYTGFPADLSNPSSSLGIENNISSILMGLDKFIIGEDNLEDWGIELDPNGRYPYLINPLWPLDSTASLPPNFNPWDQITPIVERIYYLFKWTFSLANPATGFDSKPWETGNKTLYQRIVNLENAVGSGQGDNLTTRVSHLENKLLLLYKNSLAKRKEVIVPPADGIMMGGPLQIEGGTDYICTSYSYNNSELTSIISYPSEITLDFNDFLPDIPEGTSVKDLSSNNITPLGYNKAVILFESTLLIPYMIHSGNINIEDTKEISTLSTSSKSSIEVLPENPDSPTPVDPGMEIPIPQGNRINVLLGNGIQCNLNLLNIPQGLRVLIHEPLVNGGITQGDSVSSNYAMHLFKNQNNNYSDIDSRYGKGFYKLEFIYNPAKSILVESTNTTFYTSPTLEINVFIEPSFKPVTDTQS